MGAIVGLWRRGGREAPRRELETMLAAAPHRGPDGSSIWSDGAAALGHQRFSLEQGAAIQQDPVAVDGRGTAAVLDGRIDNHSELCRRLDCPVDENPGIVLLAAYRLWGADCITRLEGDFALVIWDRVQQRMIIARDALGLRDLSYLLHRDLVLVGSEIRQIRAHPACPDPRPDEVKAALYLANSWSDQEHSFFGDIRFLPPGHQAVIDRNGIRIAAHWKADLGRRIIHKDENEYDQQFRELFRASVSRRLPRTGPIAISLSGGPDSAAVATEVADAFGPERTRAYSYVFDEFPSCDERRWIELVAADLGLHTTQLEGDHRGPLVRLGDRLVDPDCATRDPYLGLARSVGNAAAGDGCRVLVTGHYADLLFAGGDYWAGEMAASGRWLQFMRTALVHRSLLGLRQPFRHNPVAQLVPPRFRPGLTRRRGGQPWITKELEVRTDLEGRNESQASRQDATLHGRSRRLQHLMLAAEVQGTASARAMYNATGLESIDPYRDRALVEFALAVPADQLGRPHLSKWLLRRSMAGRFPDEVRLRADKTSLFELFVHALTGPARAFVESLLDRPQIVERGWVSDDWLNREIAADPPWTNHGYPLWQCIALEMWLQELWPTDRRD